VTRRSATSAAQPEFKASFRSAPTFPRHSGRSFASALVVANLVVFTLIADDVLDGGGLISHDDAVLAWFVDHRTDRMIRGPTA
jgi:hypothetical protein